MNLPANPKVIECMNRINYFLDDVKELNYVSVPNFKESKEYLYHEPKNYKTQNHIFAVDLDYTLTYHEKSLYVSHPDDIKLLPNRINQLNNIFKLGYSIVIFTNQSTIKVENAKKRFELLLSQLSIPVYIFASLKKDADNKYRKPNIGMWELFLKVSEVRDIKQLFFCGDALGRVSDFSDSDAVFGKNIGATVLSPEDVFGVPTLPVKKKLELVVFVGAPGSGKTTFYNKNYFGYTHVSKDVQKTKEMKVFNTAIKNKESIVVDNTNNTKEKRDAYISIAKANGYFITIFYFIQNGKTLNSHREKPVPDVVYHMYYKKLEPPTEDEGDVHIIF